MNSFGNETRIDYGTGHELNFIAFLTELDLLGLLFDLCPSSTENGDLSIGIQIFLVIWKYFKIVRELILYFRLEPAGSHGVWGLDDYQVRSC